jgi:hypothetical protein
MLTNPQPIKNYTAPDIPTLEAVKGDSNFLKKMPLRWKTCSKVAAVIACAGLIGSWVFTGCSERPIDVEDFGTSEIFTDEPTLADVTTANRDNVTRKADRTRRTADAPTETIAGSDDNTDELHVSTTAAATSAQTRTKARTTRTSRTARDTQITEPTIPDDKTIMFERRMSHGGSGSSPYYVVYFTEQEMLGIIRSQLEAAGLNLSSSNVPNLTARVDFETWAKHLWWDSDCCAWYEWDEFNNSDPCCNVEEQQKRWERNAPTAKIELFDRGRNVAISRTNVGVNWTESIKKDFEKQSDSTFGIFMGYSANIGWGEDRWRENEQGEWGYVPHTEQEIARFKRDSRAELEADITKQVNDFVKQLKREGILP